MPNRLRNLLSKVVASLNRVGPNINGIKENMETKNIRCNNGKKIIFILNAVSINSNIDRGFSGGERILIELTKRWKHLFNEFKIITCTSGEKILRNYINDFNNLKIDVIKTPPTYYDNLFKLYLFKTFKCLMLLKRYKFEGETYVYSSSDFWPDFIPALYAKLKNPQIKWIAGFYLFAPKPWRRNFPYKGKFLLRGLLYYLTQLPAYWLIKKYADTVFVVWKDDIKKFITKRRGKSKIIVISGGVDISESEKYLYSNNITPIINRKYDACFVGRFHHQKGVLTLVDIWRNVCERKKDAKLGMIGVGPLESEVKKKIRKYKLENNIDLLGFKDGQDKYEIFKQSKMILHPATYDEGGMAVAEGMAWALPGISFDLEALKTCYPKGMIKVKCFDLEKFAENILELLNNKNLYNKYSSEAHNLIVEVWDWDKRAEGLYNQIF